MATRIAVLLLLLNITTLGFGYVWWMDQQAANQRLEAEISLLWSVAMQP